ncbi:hypothetical protein [Candidatus Palauibacter sp.]|uniref:hypothetical protein n=1 Tax=Candidatus Palauibacter sp. TaxID=3101350 RepID=UPI003B01573B
MNFRRFQAAARRMWNEIPEEAREGVEGLTIETEGVAHPEFDWVYTMGECLTETWPSGAGGDGDVRSELVLYHGSFRALADQDPDFDWEGELWETILHELLHHRESAAGEMGLDEVDWAQEHNLRRVAGEPFDPEFYRAVPVGPDGVVRLESELFVESSVAERAVEAVFAWRGRRYAVEVPASAARAFVEVTNLAGGRLCVAVRRRRPWWRFGSSAGRQPVQLSSPARLAPAKGG